MHSLSHCPNCGTKEPFKVTESRPISDGTRRRKECLTCKARYTMYEISEDAYDSFVENTKKFNRLKSVFEESNLPKLELKHCKQCHFYWNSKCDLGNDTLSGRAAIECPSFLEEKSVIPD